jgi:hypothetical protein
MQDISPELIGAVASIGLFVFTFGKRLGKLEMKIDTIWDFLMRRAMNEMVSKGLGRMNSPMVATEESKEFFSGMASELKAFYKIKGRKMKEKELLLAIEKKFGERILKEVCIPHNLTCGSCLHIAKEIAQE